ncbi:tripartite tricarboxylate transporter substrate binding protein [Alkalihalobacillus deserti]|uniref:tripartite tricarboxylate transporter substrate binding protein n=1 Tax=Alkalihalobacillus deserti TaxID=2879466 RepID=UPI001D14310A|nr:tripartite tricarboxylate transporter substrate binding protein [Alkalihalobacillus deserti]
MKLKLLVIALLFMVVGCSSQTGSFPQKNVELVVPSSAGGGNDRLLRAVQDTLTKEELMEQNIIVANKSGGGGEVAWQHIKKQKDGHSVGLTTSLLLTNYLRDKSDLSYEDLTPIVTLASEWLVLAVNAESGLESLEEVFDQLRENPKSLKLAFGPSLGGDHHLLFLQAAQMSGIDPSELDIVVYEGGGEVTNALLGGHVNVVTHGVAALAEHHEVGSVNILAVSSSERIEELPEVPTFKEAGIDLEFPHWRGIVGPPNMSEEEVKYWEDKFAEMVETETWRTFLKNTGMSNYYKNSAETKEFLEQQNDNARELLQSAKLID